MRNYQDPRYRNVHPGDKSVVHYSASHPWMSSLGWPDRIGAMAVITLINPQHKWAFNINGRARAQ